MCIGLFKRDGGGGGGMRQNTLFSSWYLQLKPQVNKQIFMTGCHTELTLFLCFITHCDRSGCEMRKADCSVSALTVTEVGVRCAKLTVSLFQCLL